MMLPASLNKLGSKSAKASLLTISAALIFATVLLMVFQFVSLRKSVIEDVTVQSRIIADNAGAAVMFGDQEASEEILNSLRTSPAICAAAIYTRDKKLLATFIRHHDK